MEGNNLIGAVYLLSATAFVLALRQLSALATARNGLFLAAIGLVSAVVVTVMGVRIERFEYLLGGLAIGALAGMRLARNAATDSFLPAAALFNAFTGLACLLTAWAEFHAHPAGQGLLGGITLWFTVIFGSIAFSGSTAIWAKLEKKISRSEISKAAGERYFAKALALAAFIFGVLFSKDTVAPEAGRWLAFSVLFAIVLSVLWVNSLDAADFKAALALLGGCTGLAVGAAGFVFQNVLLIAAGGLASGGGVALALAMCKAENRPTTGLKNLFIG